MASAKLLENEAASTGSLDCGVAGDLPASCVAAPVTGSSNGTRKLPTVKCVRLSGCTHITARQRSRRKRRGGAYLVAAQRHFATAASAAAYVAVMANVANAIGELGLKANVTGGIQLDAGLLLLLGALSDLHLQCDNFVLLATAKREGGGRESKCAAFVARSCHSPHYLVLFLLLLLLPHEHILDLHALVRRQVRQVGHLIHG